MSHKSCDQCQCWLTQVWPVPLMTSHCHHNLLLPNSQNKFITFRTNAQKSDQPENWILNHPKIFIASHNSFWLAIMDSCQNNDFSKLEKRENEIFSWSDLVWMWWWDSDMDDNSGDNTNCLLCWGVRRYCNCHVLSGCQILVKIQISSPGRWSPVVLSRSSTIALLPNDCKEVKIVKIAKFAGSETWSAT